MTQSTELTGEDLLASIPIGSKFYKKDGKGSRRLWVYMGRQGPTTVGTYRHFFVREVRPGDGGVIHQFNLHNPLTFTLLFTWATEGPA